MKRNFSISGMPDFSPFEKRRREYILSKVKEQFLLFGFSSIQTASMTKSTSSYGEAADKLIFNILKSGNYFTKLKENYNNRETGSSDLLNLKDIDFTSLISDKSLRYDLTIPFAKYVAEHQSEITFPFKRYEIGSVWRADRPQKGRLREFTQCDADIIGDSSLWLEVDLLDLMNSIFRSLGLNDLLIKINNRKILEGIWIEGKGSSVGSFSSFCIIIDKIDKIGIERVGELLLDAGYQEDFIQMMQELFLFEGSFLDKKEYLLGKINQDNQILLKGLDELSFVIGKSSSVNNLIFDLSLARGLDYYTGAIFEVVSYGSANSLAGGGRYDNLTEKYDLRGVSGVGVSFGLDRLYLEMDELNLFDDKINNNLDVLFINFGEKESIVSQSYISELRSCGKSAELYPSNLKISKQMSYADKRGAKFVVIIGEEEINLELLTVKNMNTGKQDRLSMLEFIKLLNHEE
ncbi:MAG: histidine--tRNA ligase [Flavobacteriales bacterium]|nr:histidine--tRNA ligase [Flavobacteriales bacterium]